MFLTKDELFMLTGYKRRAKQCEQLRLQGVPFRCNAHGEPIVCKSAVENTTTKKTLAANDTWRPALSA